MKLLTFDESKAWLHLQGVRIDGNRNLWFPEAQLKCMATLPKQISALRCFSAGVNDWVFSRYPRLLWASNWETEPVYPLTLFERVRFSSACSGTLIETPGHLFEESNEQENALIAGLSFLVLAFGWEAYIVSAHQAEFVYFGDEHLVFSSPDPARITEIRQLLDSFKLKLITEVKQAW